ncbi:MAG: type III-B CRISPR module RAMP protein Cmr1 [Methanothrix sp.]|nr:type III-B CRISPR module RAMP protein Cmr1 [Methanothrix sp.]MCX8207737.1 type III-B CRISPR module RAMP protein Cmr1 [Methanothrix sp.]
MIEAKFSIVTPLFMGGADPKVPELRVPGIKGAIRFWWRALAWSWYRGDLGRIRDLEGQIFGSTKDGQSRVIMDLSGVDAKLEKENIFEKLKDQEERCQGLMYLGYGPIDKGKLTRNYLKQPVDATLRIRIRPKGNDKKDPEAPDGSEITDQISKALIAMGYFGGLGSRSRRGFGSFNLTELNVDGRNEFVCPENKDQLGEEIEKFLKGLNRYNGLPEYTAFSPKTEIYIFKNMNTDSLALLGDVGWTMRVYRLGSGNKHSRKFREDTILAKRSLKSKVDEHPRRLFFGLPHNYHFKDLKKNLEIIGENHDRRASPLLIHVQKLGTEYAAVAALMPARFLPPGEKILMRPGEEKNESEDTRIPGMGHPKSPPTSRVELDENEAEELTVIRDFLESWKRVI